MGYQTLVGCRLLLWIPGCVPLAFGANTDMNGVTSSTAWRTGYAERVMCTGCENETFSLSAAMAGVNVLLITRFVYECWMSLLFSHTMSNHFFLLLLPLIVFLFFFFFPLSFLISLSPPLPPPPLLSILLNFIFLRPFPSTSFIRPETDSRVLGLNADGRRKSCRGITIWKRRHGSALRRVNKCLGCWRSSLKTDSFLPTKGYEAWNSCAARWMPTLRKGLLLLLHDATVLHESIPLLELSHND